MQLLSFVCLLAYVRIRRLRNHLGWPVNEEEIDVIEPRILEDLTELDVCLVVTQWDVELAGTYQMTQQRSSGM